MPAFVTPLPVTSQPSSPTFQIQSLRRISIPRTRCNQLSIKMMAEEGQEKPWSGLFGLFRKSGDGEGEEKSAAAYAEPQPGDPGYEAEKAAKKLPVKIGSMQVAQQIQAQTKRGFQLLKEDLFKSAPERAGVGRQDVTLRAEPSYGEPGYQKKAYEKVNVSELGVSPFAGDANAVLKVGGKEAVELAAEARLKGISRRDVKDLFLKKQLVLGDKRSALGDMQATEPEKEQILSSPEKTLEKVYDIPDYLKPLPEDTPRRGYTWKNYEGQ